MNSSKTTLIIPIETQVRELDAKLLLSCVAAEKGFEVILGSQTKIHARIASMPRGIYLAKDMRSSKERIFSILKLLGHHIIAWDEEGLVRYPSNHYFKTRISSKALKSVDMLFAWGLDDATMIKTYSGYNGIPVHITGNPRIDILRQELRVFHQAEARRLRDKYENFILINTNFGHSNHFLNKYTVKSPHLAEGASEDDVGDWDDDLARYRNRMFEYFTAMIPELGHAFTDTNIILRPHPSESMQAWREAAAECPNIQVIQEGSVLPWLMAANVLVHNGCTTAIEGFLLGRPSVTYQPMTSARFDRHLPDSLSYPAASIDELIAKTRPFVQGLNSNVHTPEQQQSLDHHLVTKRHELASDRIINILEKADIAINAPRRPKAYSIARGRIKAGLRSGQKIFNGFVPGSKNSFNYERHRFPGVSEAEIQAGIDSFSERLGRFSHVKAKQIYDGIFRIMPQ